jgi:hypothetical protein
MPTSKAYEVFGHRAVGVEVHIEEEPISTCGDGESVLTGREQEGDKLRNKCCD